MPISFQCPSCGATLRVADEHAGRDVQCPTCSNTTTVPREQAPQGGGQQGPTPVASPAPPGWQGAPPQSPYGQPQYPGQPPYGQPGYPGQGPGYPGQYPGYPGQYGYVRAHRGGAVLTLGILSIFILGIILGTIAIVMGSSDLREMQAGRMDRSGEGSTRGGLICGIIGVVLHVLVIIIVIAANS